MIGFWAVIAGLSISAAAFGESAPAPRGEGTSKPAQTGANQTGVFSAPEQPASAATQLAGNVRAAIFGDPAFSGFDLKVVPVNGVVVLQGNVDTPFQRDQIAMRAGQVAGVSRVQNAITVGLVPGAAMIPGSAFPSGATAPPVQTQVLESDRVLRSQVRTAVFGDAALSGFNGNVTPVVVQGKVLLQGVVQSPEQRDQIGSAAARVVGPGNVFNEIVVTP
ncbi:MAG: BON domain-containing protein [Elusimicrobia bacterium]|nr:BON domain-containing protein [Elusimicrobiota bacterium]